MAEDYIKEYLERRIIVTGNKDDFILSCNIHYDLNKELYVPNHIISKTLINNTLINKKYMKSSQYYVGLKYK